MTAARLALHDDVIERALARRELLQQSRQLMVSSLASTAQQRQRTLEQRDNMTERQRRWAELLGGDARIERLWPCVSPPARLPVRTRLPRGRAAAILLCGACDEVLAVGTYAADLSVALRCPACLVFNTGTEQPPVG